MISSAEMIGWVICKLTLKRESEFIISLSNGLEDSALSVTAIVPSNLGAMAQISSVSAYASEGGT